MWWGPSCTEVWFCRVAAIDRGVSLLPYARTGSAPTRFGDSKSTFSTCFCDSGSLAEQTALASAAKESSVWPCMCWCLGYSSKSTSIPLLQWWKLHGFFEMFMSGYFHGPKYGGTSVEAFFAESCHSLPCWNNGQAELASIQMPLSVGKISWVQCGRVTNLKETNIPLYNFIMILIYGSSGSSLEPWFQWFLELRPGYLGERVLGVLG